MMRHLAGAAALLAAALLTAAGCSSGGGSASNGSPAASAATVRVANGSVGSYLTDGSGRALYLWLGDSGGTSSCSGACAQAWPPLTVRGAPAAGAGVSSAQLGTVKRADGGTQVTYDGHPLYRFTGDSAAGQTTGQGSTAFGAAWWLVAPSGSAITSGPSAPSTSSGGYNY